MLKRPFIRPWFGRFPVMRTLPALNLLHGLFQRPLAEVTDTWQQLHVKGGAYHKKKLVGDTGLEPVTSWV